MPCDIERGEFREELELAVGQVIMNPPSHGLPGHALAQSISQPRDDDGCHRAHAAIVAALIPNMFSLVARIGSAAPIKPVAQSIDFWRTIGRSDRDSTEG